MTYRPAPVFSRSPAKVLRLSHPAKRRTAVIRGNGRLSARFPAAA
jgi:hypothetical protein